MNTQSLVKMANQIGQFFESEPDQNQAIADVATHIKRSWTPGMRKAIIGYVQNGGEELLPIVQTAIRENQLLLG